MTEYEGNLSENARRGFNCIGCHVFCFYVPDMVEKNLCCICFEDLMNRLYSRLDFPWALLYRYDWGFDVDSCDSCGWDHAKKFHLCENCDRLINMEL